MGRLKLNIRKLETASQRQITYSKRKAGLAKKAMELSILCDVDVALVMFSPAGKPTICVVGNSDLSGILERFSVIPFEERTRRKVEILDILKKAFQKVGHEMDMERLLGDGIVQRVEDLQSQLRFKQALVQEKNRKMSYWTNPEKINDMPELIAVEECLAESLTRLRKRKVLLEEQLLHQALTASQGQNCAWPPAQFFHRANARSHLEPNIGTAMPPCDLGAYGNPSGSVENASILGFNQVQQFTAMGPCFGAPLENHM